MKIDDFLIVEENQELLFVAPLILEVMEKVAP
jgi:hypothetical protein